ncbi:MAG: thioredoxin domain-containing protein [Oscillospiraceae bacterium]|nr:thioredoxin domain-containing protein [Oscillospiraceae bacterium]
MKTNRLINEKSPYLYAHAENPVDWFPWGEEAFEKARTENKPIFLSIGYSTCHWCHVMERESFEDNEVAALLNEHFISVKVDREERPDVDSVYMSACQTLTGSGGWPLSILMTPEKKPFFAGTYFPKNTMKSLIERAGDMWREESGRLIQTGDEIHKHLQENANFIPARGEAKRGVQFDIVDENTVAEAVDVFASSFDKKYGGFGSAPKFPAAHNLLFLLEYARVMNSEQAGNMAQETLKAMFRGGIHDHIAGGFSRYSTDEKWLIPHFEKMLYDNALLAWAYLEAYSLYKKEIYKTAAQKIFSWVFAELTNDDGGFYCGQDADSEGVEGKYYAFSYDETNRVLNERESEIWREYYGITKNGNFEDTGKSIPNLIKNAEFETHNKLIDDCNHRIYHYRKQRVKLHTDDKILTSWNALMMIALIKAYLILGDKSYLEAAQKCEKFIAEKLSFNGRLYVSWRDNPNRAVSQVTGNGKLDDYANYTMALLELYSAANDVNYFNKAQQMITVMTEHFFDNENGGFYLYADDDEQLITRPKEVFDNALPSGNSTAFMLLDRFRRETGELHYFEMYRKQEQFIAPYARHYPTGCSFSLITALNNAVQGCKDGKC